MDKSDEINSKVGSGLLGIGIGFAIGGAVLALTKLPEGGVVAGTGVGLGLMGAIIVKDKKIL